MTTPQMVIQVVSSKLGVNRSFVGLPPAFMRTNAMGIVRNMMVAAPRYFATVPEFHDGAFPTDA